MTDQKQTPESNFHASLTDAITVLEKLSPLCETFEELHGMLTYALDNPGQLRLLMSKVAVDEQKPQRTLKGLVG